MRLEFLYRLRLSYREQWSVGGTQEFGVAEGRCEGRVSGRFVGANHGRVAPDGLHLPHIHGFIETDEGATLLTEYRGRGRVEGDGGLRAVAAALHVTGDDGWKRLNDTMCFVEAAADGDAVVLDVYEQVWEPIAE